MSSVVESCSYDDFDRLCKAGRGGACQQRRCIMLEGWLLLLYPAGVVVRLNRFSSSFALVSHTPGLTLPPLPLLFLVTDEATD